MYREYFGLQDNPFSTTPDLQYFYLAPSHSESMSKCEYAIRNQSGLAVVYGDVGTGKTTILNKLKERFSDEEYTIAVLNNPKQNSDTALLKAIAEEFGLKSPRTKQKSFDQLQGFLAKEVIDGRTPLLLIDEAQEISSRADRDCLGLIKTLTNMTLKNYRLIQIVLFGQLELIPLLEKRRELKSRVFQFGILSPLAKKDAIAMMEHRWLTAKGNLPLPFEDDALELLFQVTKGLPRDIIKVSNSALTHSFAKRQKIVPLESVQYAIDEHLLSN